LGASSAGGGAPGCGEEKTDGAKAKIKASTNAKVKCAETPWMGPHGRTKPRRRGAAGGRDLDELLELSDRLVVMFHGQFVHEARASEADLTEVGRQMAGH
jgi:hypothetical protein